MDLYWTESANSFWSDAFEERDFGPNNLKLVGKGVSFMALQPGHKTQNEENELKKRGENRKKRTKQANKNTRSLSPHYDIP